MATSAMKRSTLISYSEIMDVLRHGDFLGADKNGLLWFLGTTKRGLNVEIAAFTTDDGALIAVHAFPMDWRKR